MSQKFFKIKYISKSNTVNNMKPMILAKIRVIHICSSSPRAASVNRDDIDPDKLKNGITDYPSPEDKEILYMFFARYVQKAHSNGAIKSELRNNVGLLFIDIISPRVIAFVISVINNGRDVWDQKIRMKELGAAVHS